MMESLEPLARIPGVRLAALVTDDGVPVAVPGWGRGGKAAEKNGTRGTRADMVDEVDGLAAVAVGWLDELAGAGAALTWGAPDRVIMRAARGTLVLLRTSGAVLVTVIEAGLDPDEMKLPMDGVAARIQRMLRHMGSGTDADSTDRTSETPTTTVDDSKSPEAPLPAPGEAEADGDSPTRIAGHGADTTGR